MKSPLKDLIDSAKETLLGIQGIGYSNCGFAIDLHRAVMSAEMDPDLDLEEVRIYYPWGAQQPEILNRNQYIARILMDFAGRKVLAPQEKERIQNLSYEFESLAPKLWRKKVTV